MSHKHNDGCDICKIIELVPGFESNKHGSHPYLLALVQAVRGLAQFDETAFADELHQLLSRDYSLDDVTTVAARYNIPQESIQLSSQPVRFVEPEDEFGSF